eukprot:4727705-Pleurochrysis_carterae.AAC.1
MRVTAAAAVRVRACALPVSVPPWQPAAARHSVCTFMMMVAAATRRNGGLGPGMAGRHMNGGAIVFPVTATVVGSLVPAQQRSPVAQARGVGGTGGKRRQSERKTAGKVRGVHARLRGRCTVLLLHIAAPQCWSSEQEA